MTSHPSPHTLIILIFFLLIAACGGDEGETLSAIEVDVQVDTTFASLGERFPGYLGSATDLDVDEGGRIYVLDDVESHVVVFDQKLQPIRVIGRYGEGPGEMLLPRMGAHSNRLAVGAGLLAVMDGRSRIHVFDQDGTFLKRFPTGRTVTDVAITPDRRVVCARISGEHPLIEFSATGDSLRAYGVPMLPIEVTPGPGMRRDLARFHIMNQGQVEVLSDGTVVTLNTQWPVLRFYRKGDLIHESRLPVRRLGELMSEDGRRVLEQMMGRLEEMSPERLTRLYEAGRLNQAEHSPGGHLLYDLTRRGDELWLFFGGFLSRLDREGSPLEVYRAELGAAAAVGFHGSRVVASPRTGARLLTFRIP